MKDRQSKLQVGGIDTYTNRYMDSFSLEYVLIQQSEPREPCAPNREYEVILHGL